MVDIACKKAYLLNTNFSDSGSQLISSISVPKYCGPGMACSQGLARLKWEGGRKKPEKGSAVVKMDADAGWIGRSEDNDWSMCFIFLESSEESAQRSQSLEGRNPCLLNNLKGMDFGLQGTDAQLSSRVFAGILFLGVCNDFSFT